MAAHLKAHFNTNTESDEEVESKILFDDPGVVTDITVDTGDGACILRGTSGTGKPVSLDLNDHIANGGGYPCPKNSGSDRFTSSIKNLKLEEKDGFHFLSADWKNDNGCWDHNDVCLSSFVKYVSGGDCLSWDTEEFDVENYDQTPRDLGWKLARDEGGDDGDDDDDE